VCLWFEEEVRRSSTDVKRPSLDFAEQELYRELPRVSHGSPIMAIKAEKEQQHG
jgi:hypothetical protein